MSYESDVIRSLHEAGHAVATVVFGGEVEFANMDKIRIVPGSLDPWSDAVMSCAGSAAARALGPRARVMARDASISDNEGARRALAKMGEGYYLADAQQEANRFVRMHDRSIQRVAEALRKRGELTGAEVRAIMGGSAVEGSTHGRTTNPKRGEVPGAPKASDELVLFREYRLNELRVGAEIERWVGNPYQASSLATHGRRLARLNATIAELEAAA